MIKIKNSRKESQTIIKDHLGDEIFKNIFIQSPIAIIIYDDNGNLLDVNHASLDMFGLSKLDRIEYMNMFDNPYFTGEDKQKLKAEGRVKFQSIIDFDGDGGYYNPDKSGKIYTKWIITALEESGYLVMIQDISDEKKLEKDLERSRDFYLTLFEEFPALIWRAGVDAKCNYFNKRWLQFTGRTMEQEVGDGWAEGVHPDDFDHCFEVYSTAFEAREPFEMEYRLLHNTGEYRWILDLGMPFYDLDENFAGYIGSCYDITKQKELVKQIEKSLEEKELLLKEIHHRVKNNLMIISSLLNLQSRYIEDKKYKDIFRESQNRAKSMALIHERLYKSTDLKRIDFGDYIRTLANDLFHTYISDPSRIQMAMNIEEVRLDINTAIPLGLIVNELISNSMKHAFPDGMKGKININFHLKGDKFILTVRDNGVGFPKDMDYKNTESLGLQIINSLTDQIDGKLEFNGSNGTEFKIRFKERDYY